MAEWLRRWTANPLGSPRVGSNPILVVFYFFKFIIIIIITILPRSIYFTFIANDALAHTTGFQARSKDLEILEEGGGAGLSTMPRRDHE